MVLHIGASLEMQEFHHLDRRAAELQPNLQFQLLPPPEQPPYNKQYPLPAHLRNPSAENLAKQGEKAAAMAASARAQKRMLVIILTGHSRRPLFLAVSRIIGKQDPCANL